MIKHIVVWRLKDMAHGNDKATNARLIQQKLEALRGAISGLLAIEVGIDSSASAHSADVVLYSEFTSLQALQSYQAHPLHQAVAAFVAEAQLERRVVDYEPSPR
jgi:hypothetical protein